MSKFKINYDVVIVGSGHNGLVAASYLSNHGLSTLILERNDYIGGATKSARIFKGFDANLSVYSYLLSLFPGKIKQDLGLNLKTIKRDIGSYTPAFGSAGFEELLEVSANPGATQRSFQALTGTDEAYHKHAEFMEECAEFASLTWPTLLEPLRTKGQFGRLFKSRSEKRALNDILYNPLGEMIERHIDHDLIRGVRFTDGKIGVHTHPHDESLLQNKCFMYHIIGQGTGDWDVPVGGMGALVSSLVESLASSTDYDTGTEVKNIDHGPNTSTVHFVKEGIDHTVDAKYVLINASPHITRELLPSLEIPTEELEGAVFKMNMLLSSLPKVRNSRHSPKEAFAGTFHMNEGYQQMIESFEAGQRGELPDKLPGEMYCHTLSDPSILSSKLQEAGYHTITLFGLDTPYSMFNESNNTELRQTIQDMFLDEMNEFIEGDIREHLAVDDGKLCVESKTPLDLEREVGLSKGNIFHSVLTGPHAEDDSQAGTWGVETNLNGIYICGSSAIRGGAVSGVPGHNAAMKVLEEDKI